LSRRIQGAGARDDRRTHAVADGGPAGRGAGRDRSARRTEELRRSRHRGCPRRDFGDRARAPTARPDLRLALPRGPDHGDDFCGLDRDRRLVGDAARRHGCAEHEAQRLRCAPLGRRHRGRRNARHPDPAFRHADRDGPGGRGANDRTLRRGRDPRADARRALRRLYARPKLSQPEPRAAAADGGARRLSRRNRARVAARHRARRRRDLGDARRDPGRDRDPDRRRRGWGLHGAAAHPGLQAHELGEAEERRVLDAGDLQHDPAARRGLELFRRGVLAARQREPHRRSASRAAFSADRDADPHPGADLRAGLAAGMGADRADRRADPAAAGAEARHRPRLVLHARRGLPPDRVALAAGRLVGLFPQGRGAGLEALRHLCRNGAVHGSSGDRARTADPLPAACAVAAGRPQGL
ncbi:MAG: TRAP-type C4-dicarboxylate transport system, large permease component, partial [uncultured Microvirga sp.]